MSKIANHMTRIVAIGKLESYEYKTSPFKMGKGVLDIGKGQKVRFTVFNNEQGTNPHTKAADFNEEFENGDLVFITGNDNRSYSEEKDRYYEDIMLWDYRRAEEDEQHRYVFVYIGDIKKLNEEKMILSFINYKNEEMLFDINIDKANKDEGIEVGARVKVKGEIFVGMKMDFYGDGEFVTERNAVTVELINTAEEVEEHNKEKEEEEKTDSSLWE